ncbi:hypothetical protein ATG_07420 [Desulfurococcaceae archaeon AG1]|jgi:NAD+ kinase|nr:MAG: hypothetical protein DJ555_03530 [Desulfurococcaceae archaeon]GAY25539.1 hypothetical protein ATG_07420 [Desulfurococcaceae archaeon AG1]
MKIGVYFRPSSELAAEIASRVIDEGVKNGAEMYIEESLLKEPRAATIISSKRVRAFSFEKPEVDVIAVVGGDGTLLRALHMLGDHRIPVMTIRMGRRGFLLDVTPLEIPERISDLLRGKYNVVSYTRLSARIGNEKMPPALNEVSVVASTRSKVIRLKVYRDDKFVYYMEGDGVIVATPLGSTAYSMSAGGPILDHNLRGFVVTPLAPVQAWLRPVVFDLNTKIRVVLAENSIEGYVIVDGQASMEIPPGGAVLIEVHHEPARIIRFHDIDTLYERIFPRVI